MDRHARIIGLSLIGFGSLIFFLTFLPVAREEVRYAARRILPQPSVSPAPVEPASREFGIIIPKIAANAPVVPEVNPYLPEIYQHSLTRGVAHAKGSAFPGEAGNTFLFAHSAGNWTEANRYNAVFYLISKLVPGDEIIVWYNYLPFTYIVNGSKIAEDSEIWYLNPHYAAKNLTLMTCWPPGTTVRRFIVTAALKE